MTDMTATTLSTPNRSVTVQLEPADYLAASRLHSRRQIFGGGRRGINITVIVALVLLGFIAAFALNPGQLLRTLGILIVCLIAILVIAHFLIIPYQVRKIFREQKTLHVPYVWTWTEQGLEIRSEKYGHTTYPWSDLFRWEEDQHIFLFYHSSRLFSMLPRRVLSEAQADDLRRCIQAARL
ncbi:MAG: YcxB family protein [Methylobacillus sp.]|jgi:hypothetical protein|nr:YcxB family protein [Methylobacillus sp.]